MPGYHTGPGAYLGYMTGARHSHLDGAGYSLDQKAFTTGKVLSAQDVVDALLKEERWRQVLSSLVICFFARGIYTPEVVTESLRTVGYDLSEDYLGTLGRDTHRRKYAFKVREGFSLDNVRIPKRILQTATPVGKVSEDLLREALSIFKREMRLATGGACAGECC